MTTASFKLPTITELFPLIKAVKADICDDYRCSDDPDDETPGIILTIGANEEGEWSYQTGDNSYSGGAYGFPHWAVVYVYRNSNCREIAKEVRSELEELMSQY